MKSSYILVTAAVTLALTGCASSGVKKGEIPTIESQTFATNIPGETIKIDKKCGWLWNRNKCEVLGIEAVGVASSVGATRVIQNNITEFACDNAKSNIVKYVFGEKVSENRRNVQRNRQNENQKDRFKSATEIGPDVEMNPDDPNRDTNYSVREALINSDIDIVKTQTFSSQGTLVNFYKKSTSVVDSKTISCTVAWSKRDAIGLRPVRNIISGG